MGGGRGVFLFSPRLSYCCPFKVSINIYVTFTSSWRAKKSSNLFTLKIKPLRVYDLQTAQSGALLCSGCADCASVITADTLALCYLGADRHNGFVAAFAENSRRRMEMCITDRGENLHILSQ